MEIKLIRGCMCDSLAIDGVQEMALLDEQKKEVLKHIFERFDTKDLNSLLQYLAETFGDWHEEGICNACGDTIDVYTLKI